MRCQSTTSGKLKQLGDVVIVVDGISAVCNSGTIMFPELSFDLTKKKKKTLKLQKNLNAFDGIHCLTAYIPTVAGCSCCQSNGTGPHPLPISVRFLPAHRESMVLIEALQWPHPSSSCCDADLFSCNFLSTSKLNNRKRKQTLGVSGTSHKKIQ